MQQKADSYYKMKRNMIWNKYNSKCSSVGTKWMDIFIKYLIPLWLVCIPLINFGSVYNTLNTYYSSNWTYYFSYPINVILFITLIIKFICVIVMFYYLKRLSHKGIIALYTFTFLSIAETIILLINSIQPTNILMVIALIINAIYFFKRRNLFKNAE